MPFDRVQLSDDTIDAEHLNRIQANIARAVTSLETGPVIVKVTFGAANVDTRLFHNLGRALVGYRPVRASAAIAVYDGSPSSDPGKFANVKASATGTITFEVF